MAANRHWWDRDPVKLWAPMAALVAAWLQTVAYAGYQAFYAAFGVRADEVGFDYTGTLRRSSVAIFISFAMVLLFLAFLAMLLPFVGVTWVAGSESGRSSQLARDYPARARRQLGLGAAWTLTLVVTARLTEERVTVAVYVVVSACLLALDAGWSRLRGEPSTLSVFLEPRPQRGVRSLLVLGAALAIGAGVNDWRMLPLVAVSVFWFDRAVSRDTADRAPAFTERIRLVPLGFVSALATVVIAGVAVGLVTDLDWTLRLAHLDAKRLKVRGGDALGFEPFAPFGLIQPQALRVAASWIGSDPPPAPFPPPVDGRPQPYRLTLFGRDSGTTVLYDSATTPFCGCRPGSLYVTSAVPEVSRD